MLPLSFESNNTIVSTIQIVSDLEIARKNSIVESVIKKTFHQQLDLLGPWHFLTIEELNLVLFLKLLPHIGKDSDVFTKLYGPLTKLFTSSQFNESPQPNHFEANFDIFKAELSKTDIDKGKLNDILTLLKRLQVCNGTQIYKKKVSVFLESLPVVSLSGAFVDLAVFGSILSERISSAMTKGIMTAFQGSDLLKKAPSRTKQDNPEPYCRYFNKKLEKEKKTLKHIQTLPDSKVKFQKMGLWLHQYTSTLQSSMKGLEENKEAFSNQSLLTGGIDSMLKGIGSEMKSQMVKGTGKKDALNLFSDLMKSLPGFLDFTIKFGCDVLLSAPFQKKFILLLTKMYEECEGSVSVTKQDFHDQDWMKLVDEWDDDCTIDKKVLEKQKTLPRVTLKKEYSKADTQAESQKKKTNAGSQKLKPEDVASSSNINVENNVLVPIKSTVDQETFNHHLNEVEYHLRAQAISFWERGDHQLVWFKKICFKEAGYHVAALRQTLNAFLTCSQQGKEYLLDGFPLVFMRHQHLAEEHLSRFENVDSLLKRGGCWSDLHLSHSLQEASGKENYHFASLDLGTLWARYPNRYENKPQSLRLKWLVDNTNPINWTQAKTTRFDVNSQKMVLKSLIQTIKNFENESLINQGLGNKELELSLLRTPCQTPQASPLDISEKPYPKLHQIEKNLMGQLAHLRSTNLGLQQSENILADRICRDVIMHINHLTWSLQLFKELNDPAFAAMHAQNVVWNMQFFFEQYFEMLGIQEGYGVIEDHNLESYAELLSKTFKKLDPAFLSQLNIKMGTSYMYYMKAVLDQNKQSPQALDFLLQGYRLSSDYQVTGEQALCNKDLTFKEFKENLNKFVEQFTECALRLTEEVNVLNSHKATILRR